MKLIKLLKGLAVSAATFGLLIPYPAITNASENATATRQAEIIRDLALGAGGVLRGQVMNKNGLPDGDATISVIRDGETVATVKADKEGSFRVLGISGGVYAVSSGKATGVVRVWTHQTAPPAASQAVLLVPSDLTVRGQGQLHGWLHDRLGGLSLGQVGLGGLLVLGFAGTIIAIAATNNNAS